MQWSNSAPSATWPPGPDQSATEPRILANARPCTDATRFVDFRTCGDLRSGVNRLLPLRLLTGVIEREIRIRDCQVRLEVSLAAPEVPPIACIDDGLHRAGPSRMSSRKMWITECFSPCHNLPKNAGSQR